LWPFAVAKDLAQGKTSPGMIVTPVGLGGEEDGVAGEGFRRLEVAGRGQELGLDGPPSDLCRKVLRCCGRLAAIDELLGFVVSSLLVEHICQQRGGRGGERLLAYLLEPMDAGPQSFLCSLEISCQGLNEPVELGEGGAEGDEAEVLKGSVADVEQLAGSIKAADHCIQAG
jgi:hypothetical protein